MFCRVCTPAIIPVITVIILTLTLPTFLQYLQQTKGTSTESSVIFRNFSQTGEWVVDSSNVILSESAWMSCDIANLETPGPASLLQSFVL